MPQAPRSFHFNYCRPVSLSPWVSSFSNLVQNLKCITKLDVQRLRVKYAGYCFNSLDQKRDERSLLASSEPSTHSTRSRNDKAKCLRRGNKSVIDEGCFPETEGLPPPFPVIPSSSSLYIEKPSSVRRPVAWDGIRRPSHSGKTHSDRYP